MQDLRFAEVTPDTWSDFERLFESRGAPKYCWCMVWRDMPSKNRSSSSAKKASIEDIIKTGTPVGILGYVDDEPVAWCSVAPRPTFRTSLGGVHPEDEDPDAVWSITCFFVPRRMRGSGMGRKLLEAAIEHARSRGAKVLEAYPVDPDSPSYLFMGFTTMFGSAGFIEVGREGTRRHVMRLEL